MALARQRIVVSRLALPGPSPLCSALQVGLLQERVNEKVGEAVALYNQLYQMRKLLPQELAVQAERDASAATSPPGSPLPVQGRLCPCACF